MTAGRSVLSDRKDWCTPPHYVAAVRECLGGNIALDPCSNRYSQVRAAVEFSPPKRDGLSEAWNYPTIFVNPPYGADRSAGTTIKDWLRRCADAHARYRSEVLALVPVATNTSHWKQFVWGSASGVAFLYDTRLKFLENGRPGMKGAPMSCAMVYWGGKYERFFRVFSRFGAVLDLTPLHGHRIGEADEPASNGYRPSLGLGVKRNGHRRSRPKSTPIGDNHS